MMDYLPILLGGVISMAVGWPWFGPLFGKVWREGSGLTQERILNSNMGLSMGISFLLSCVIAYQMKTWAGYHARGEAEDLTFIHGAFHGAKGCLMMVIPVLVSVGLYNLKSWSWILVTALYWIIVFALIAGAMFAMTSPEVVAQ